MAPALAIFNNQLWVAFVANNESNDLLICSSPDGRTWSPSSRVGGQHSKTAPSLAVANNQLWVAFVANNESGDVVTCASLDGRQWSDNVPVRQRSQIAPILLSA